MNRIGVLRLALTLLLICWGYFAFAQAGTSNQGKEFWTAYMSHTEDAGVSRMSLYITSDVNTSGVAEAADGSFSIPFNVTAKQITTVTIPHSAFLKLGGQFLKGIHITSQRNIAVYAHIYASSVSGATLLLPVNVLGRNYFSINYTQRSNARDNAARSAFMVIATEDNTTVEIVPSRLLDDGHVAATPFSITLQKGEVYQGLSTMDLTNTRIKSVPGAGGECKKIAVFSGSSKIAIGCQSDDFTSDNLFQQAYPTSSWGKNYITVPLKTRDYDVYRVVVSDPNTLLNINGVVIDKAQFASSFYYEFNSRQPSIITADKPIQVVQYAVTEGKALDNGCQLKPGDLGDPEMIYLNPIEQTLNHVTLYSTREYNISRNFVNVVIKTSAIGSFMVDGKPYTEFEDVGPLYSYAQIMVGSGTHSLSADEGFNAIAYGFGSKESYGYAAGTNLKNLNEYIVLANSNTNTTQVNGCTGIEYKIQLAIPYQTTRIKWNFNDGNVPYTDNNPVVRSTITRDGKTLYIYEYYKKVTFTKGSYHLTGTVVNPVADECGTDADIDFDFDIADYPGADFTMAAGCVDKAVQFTDATDVKGNVIKRWLWDFGDGQTSAEQNPVHVYTRPGDYNVVLSVENENGCASVSAAKPMHVYERPVAGFTTSGARCAGQDILFTDKSVPSEGSITQWSWDFGDGTTPEVHTDQTPFTHVFAATGSFTVKLTVTNANGCESDVFQKQMAIGLSPVADFLLPNNCVDDQFAKFINKSTIADGSDASLTYRWDFGDTDPVSGRINTSTEKDGKHKYRVAGTYTVALTVTSANGCSSIKIQEFILNGGVVHADFEVQNANGLCSSNELRLRDKSTVDLGKINRIIVYYDFTNHPQQYEVYDATTIPADGIYKHDYGTLTADKQYRIKLEAFSGEVCGNSHEELVTIKANPSVLVAKIGGVCYGDGPVTIGVNFNGFTGTGSFSGPGIIAGGMFDPRAAGVGTHTINYNFTAQNGCPYFDTQTIMVNPDPTISAGQDVTQLEGEGIILKASAAGNGLTYKWTPSVGLDNDAVVNPVVNASESITYKLTVTSAEGCTAFDEVFVNVLKKPVVINAFTPNGDGINDTWTIKYIETYPGNTVDIYNRQGEKVYSSIGYAIPWDGRYRGSILPAGTYYYIINPKNGRKLISGSVTIIR